MSMAWSKTDAAAASRRHYEANKDLVKRKARTNAPKLKARNAKYVNSLKSAGVCIDCKKSFPFAAMDFHHLANKKDSISHLVISCASLKRIQEEIDKCILICANCHRIRHFGDSSNGRTGAFEALNRGSNP